MKQKTLMARAVVVATAAIWFSSSALAAQCGSLSWTATSKNERRAIFQAQRIGQQDIDRLNLRYGDNIEFQRQRIACKGGKGVTCRVTQRYCIADYDDGRDPGYDYDDPDTSYANSRQCRIWNSRCEAGRRSACIDYESNCQND
jgi:hypothetical protein